MNRVIVAACVALAIANSAPTTAAPLADAHRQLSDAAKVVEQTRNQIASEDWQRARCVAVIPGFLGTEHGGVVSCRSADGWSAPLFVQLAKGSWRFQTGSGAPIDLVLLVMRESGVEKLLRDSITLGPGASEILSYSLSQGLFATVDVSGGVLAPDEGANVEVYGRGAAPRTILATRELSAPTDATPFLRALRVGSGSDQGGTGVGSEPRQGRAGVGAGSGNRGTEPDARGPSRSMTDEELRAQLVDAEHTIDRMLAEATVSAVGTSGRSTTDDERRTGTITVDRARLLQLRQQLEALLARLSRR